MALQPLFPAEENNEVSWYTSGLAGIASGGIKVVEGAFSLEIGRASCRERV